MAHYMEFVKEWVGMGFAFPFLFCFTLFGPFFLLFIGDSRHKVIKNTVVFLATCMFFSYFFLCLASGIYFGKFYGLGGWGILLGFVLFVGSVSVYVFLESFVKKYSRVSN